MIGKLVVCCICVDANNIVFDDIIFVVVAGCIKTVQNFALVVLVE